MKPKKLDTGRPGPQLPTPGTPIQPPADGAEIPFCRQHSAPAAPPLTSLLERLSSQTLPSFFLSRILVLRPKPRCHLWKTGSLSANIWCPPRILHPSVIARRRGRMTRSEQRSISRRAVCHSEQNTEETPRRALVPRATKTNSGQAGPCRPPGLQRKVSVAWGRGRPTTGPQCRTGTAATKPPRLQS